MWNLLLEVKVTIGPCHTGCVDGNLIKAVIVVCNISVRDIVQIVHCKNVGSSEISEGGSWMGDTCQ